MDKDEFIMRCVIAAIQSSQVNADGIDDMTAVSDAARATWHRIRNESLNEIAEDE